MSRYASLPRLLRTCAIPLFVSGIAYGQSINALNDMTLTQLADVKVVSAARHEQDRVSSPRSMSVITAEEIRRRNFRNVPEAVGSLAGVYLQQTNYGGGSPIIRGMVGNRVLIMVNGIRLNNATYRYGPNQYLNSIDIHQVERIEVVRGAGSVLYGSDALAGVINVITKQAPDARHGSEFGAYTHVRFGSADSSGAGRIETSGHVGKVGFLGGFTKEQFGDLHGGIGRGLMTHTGYRHQTGDFSLRFAAGAKGSIVAGASRVRQRDVERNDTLWAGTDLEYVWQPQGRDMLYVQYTAEELGRYVSAVQVSFSYQRPIEYLRRIAATDATTERRHWDTVDMLETGVQFTSSLGKLQVLTYGFGATSDWVGSTRTDMNLRTGAVTKKAGNYPDGSRFSTLAFFVQDEIQVWRHLDAVAGVRYERIHIRAGLFDAPSGAFSLDGSPSAFTGSAHLLYKLKPYLALTGGVSQGFRAPNIDDSTILGGSGARYEIPNGNLKPERNLNIEYGVRLQNHRGQISVAAFADRYRDLIDRAPALYQGLPFLDLNGNGIKDGKELDIYQRQNVSRAIVRGVEFESLLNISPSWTWSHTTTYTRGSDISQHQPLTRIPPLNGVSRLTWQSRRPFWIEGAMVASLGQHRLSPADRSDIRIGPWGTGGYAVFHLRTGLNRTALSGLAVTLENVTNRRYKLHGSGLDRPGMNVVVGYARSF